MFKTLEQLINQLKSLESKKDELEQSLRGENIEIVKDLLKRELKSVKNEIQKLKHTRFCSEELHNKDIDQIEFNSTHNWGR